MMPSVKQQHAMEQPASSCSAMTSMGAVSQYIALLSSGPSLSSLRSGLIRWVAGNLVLLPLRRDASDVSLSELFVTLS